MAFDPILGGLSLGATVAGGILSRNEALANAQREAAARNAILADNIRIEEGFADQNKGVFDANVAGYSAPAQEAQLASAQDKRAGDNVAALTAGDSNSVPTQSDASPAVKSEIAKRMLTVFNQSKDRAVAAGKLGGYSDTWLENQLRNKQADRDIGVTNNYAEGRKALLKPMQDAAAAGAYKPPSVWGTLLKGVGSIGAAASGAGGFGGGDGGMTGFSPDGAAFYGNGSQSSMGGGAGGGVWG